ncbi:CD27 antigen [Mastacembelus armatus]|uniref:CD27 antigen n=1 Tax=Mastacembelus armatus TaxID=205130 RepID=UPI000E46477B|nr:CD27 antigen-like [Mastacembelus armatus]
MQSLYRIAFTVLGSLSFLSSVLSIQCNQTQYPWPVEKYNLCCNMCPPGKHMARRDENVCKIDCGHCPVDRYTDSYNVEMSCNICKNCNKTNMEYKSQCNRTHNAVCRCKNGYRCKDQPCTQCVPLPATTKPTILPSTIAATPDIPTSSQPIRDTVWFLVIIALLCAGFALVVVTKIKPFLRWIRAKQGYFLTEKPALGPPCSEDEEVSKPVQEVCGKCDQPIDV